MSQNVHGIEAPIAGTRMSWTGGFLSAGSVFEGLFDLDGGHCKASDVTWELGFQLLWGGQKMELFEDEKASPEGFVGEATVLQVHRRPSTHDY